MLREVTGGITWTLASQLAKVITQVGYLAVMSWILSPEDFGLFAMVTPVSALLLMFQDFGIGQAVVTEKEISPNRIAQLNTVCLLISASATTVMLLVAAPLAEFYEQPRLTLVVGVLALALLPTGMGIVTQARMARELQFRELSIIDFCSTMVGYIVSLLTAVVTKHPLSLGILNFSAAVVSLLVMSTLMRGTFSLAIPKKESFATLRIGSQLFVFNILNLVARNADKIIVGRIFGAGSLGVYDRAYKLLMLPLQQINNPVSKVVIPMLARKVDDAEAFRRLYILAVAFVMIITIPAVAYLSVYADIWLPLLFGSQWIETVDLFRLLAVAGGVQVMTNTSGWLFISQRRTTEFVWLGCINTVSCTVAFLIGSMYSVNGVATAYAISELVIRAPATVFIATRRGHVQLRHYLGLCGLNILLWCLTLSAILPIRTIDEISAPVMLTIGLLVAGITLILYILVATIIVKRLGLLDLGLKSRSINENSNKSISGSGQENKS